MSRVIIGEIRLKKVLKPRWDDIYEMIISGYKKEKSKMLNVFYVSNLGEEKKCRRIYFQ